MTAERAERLAALRRARRNRPWTDELLRSCASDPAAFKAAQPACSACDRPCRDDEVCATAVAKSDGLFESMGRDQTYHLLAAGMKRLRARGTATLRNADRQRPNAFLSATADDADTPEAPQ
ncbi:hypothetical protein [Haloferax sulfurifontis]|uniref:Uncharacterized protein n=1 Tax=Haloferax sulfurifontis TaxID=255616 RepID=A0A830E2W1_9EURY|nr:hypothetical protein [Haloferax sulfurifontis]GGC71917.1 hypothetical protein GCM10007209_37300 [Haloferax sulfurifontis]